jgi:hypothetical protein
VRCTVCIKKGRNRACGLPTLYPTLSYTSGLLFRSLVIIAVPDYADNRSMNSGLHLTPEYKKTAIAPRSEFHLQIAHV